MAQLLPHAGCHLSAQFRLCYFRSPQISICIPPRFIAVSSSPRRRTLHVRSYRQWNSNAEFLDSDAQEEAAEPWDELLQDYIDSIWIIKVFKSFGWMLPVIVISMLLTTGPKAFLLALSLPVGQSTFGFAIHRFQNRNKIKHNKSITRTNTNKGRRTRHSRNAKSKGTVAESNIKQEGIKKKERFQSWAGENNASVSNSGQSALDFGGWDELDERNV